MNIKEFKQFLPYAFKTNLSVMLHGQHGIGKSQAIKQFALENGMQFVDRRLSQMESGDLLGLPDVSGEVTRYKIPSWLPTDPNSKGILFLDELNRARRDVLQGIFQLALDRELGDYRLPEGWHVVSAVNPNTDAYVVTDILDKALEDRFIHIKLTPTLAEFFDFQKQNGAADQDFISFLQADGNDKFVEDATLSSFSVEKRGSRRSNEAAARLIKNGLPESLLIEALSGLVGITAATSFVSWKKENNVKPFTGFEIARDYATIKAKVKEYADPASGNMRHDVIVTTADNVRSYIENNYETLQGNQVMTDNLVAFVSDIPKDIGFNLLTKLAEIAKTDEKCFITYIVPTFLEREETNFILEEADFKFIAELEAQEQK